MIVVISILLFLLGLMWGGIFLVIHDHFCLGLFLMIFTAIVISDLKINYRF